MTSKATSTSQKAAYENVYEVLIYLLSTQYGITHFTVKLVQTSQLMLMSNVATHAAVIDALKEWQKCVMSR